MSIRHKKLAYYVLDVFTNELYQGNPLSVVCTNEDLEIQEYHKIAREFGYSETSFIYYSAVEKSLKVRSFTPIGIEVGGAGHNLLGAVYFALLKNWEIFSQQESERYVIMKDKSIPLFIKYDLNDTLFVSMLQQPASLLGNVPAEAVAQAISLHPNDLVLKNWKPEIVKTEVTHLMVPVKNIDRLNQVLSNKVLLSQLAEEYGFEGCYCFTFPENETTNIAQSRFFNPGIGIDEDAATGSAAGPLAGFLHNKGYILLNKDYTILQGVEMGQPSIIQFRVSNEGVWISGSAVIVMEGSLYL